MADPRPTPADADASIPTFASLGLPASIIGALADQGIDRPFPIQAATLPDALAGRDLLGRGRTGSGKTLAFVLPTVARLAADGVAPEDRPKGRRPRALILAPTRELVTQINETIMPLTRPLRLRTLTVFGGVSAGPQIDAFRRGVDVVIACPGRLEDHVGQRNVRLDDIEITVLDEADHMAEMGFLEAITELLDLMPADGQRLLFSATLDRGIDGIVARYLIDPVTHATESGQASVATMDHHVLHVEPHHKAVVTAEIAAREGRTVVFVRTKLGADRVAEQLRSRGVVAAALHGGLTQGARNGVLNAFREGTLPVLVATDVAARGIHVDDVGLVLQVDPPQDHKDYLHRAGRTARAGDRGTVVTLALPHQRRAVDKMTSQAGIDVRATAVRPGDQAMHQATGSRHPDGPPVTLEDLRRMTSPGRRPARPGRSGRPNGAWSPSKPGQKRQGRPRGSESDRHTRGRPARRG